MRNLHLKLTLLNNVKLFGIGENLNHLLNPLQPRVTHQGSQVWSLRRIFPVTFYHRATLQC